MDSLLLFCLVLVVSISFAEDCSSDACKADKLKTELLSWYNQWMKGFNVDYIDINRLRDSYDFIVIGAGIGGSIVAHRLAMDSSYPKVLLLEAGGPHNTSGLSSELIPIMTATNQLTELDWQYKTQPSNGFCCKWYKNQSIAMPRGKGTGGSAILNYMMWVRGHKQDWDVLFNIDEWKWNDVLPYFIKSESLHRYNGKCNNVRKRGCNGPMIINDGRNLFDKNSILHENILNGFLDSKMFKFLKNGQNSVSGSNVGVSYVEFNVDDTGHRNNAFLAYNKYLRSKYSKEYKEGLINLDILTNAHVTKILFDKDDGDKLTAKGVEFADLMDNKKLYTINLSDSKKNEIILSGGSINNPQILMLSGLGPKKELEKHNINVIRDIPGIGNNLQDHLMFFIRYHIKPEYQFIESINTNRIERALTNFTEFKNYLFEGKSVLSTSSSNVNAFIRSHVMNAKYGTKHSYPDLQFYVLASWDIREEPFNLKSNYMKEYECGDAEYLKDKINMDNIVAIVGLQHPESKGWVKLASSNPFDHPLIQPNFLKEQFDVDSLIEGVKIMNDVMMQPSIKKFWDQKMVCKKYGDVTNNETNLEAYIRDSIKHIYHPIGTCSMGDIEKNKLAVVDNKLLVRGTSNLRVVDASIYPLQTSGNTQAPTHMVGEKASDIILNRWNSYTS